nr:DUF3169 family protein [Mammaliicoccus sp. Marseille-Q6498]
MKNKKILMIGNFILYMIIGGLIGGLSSTFLSDNHGVLEIKLTKTQTDIATIVILVFIIVLIFMLMNVYKKAKNLREIETTEENEDEIEIQLERTLIFPPVLLGLVTTLGLIILNIAINMTDEPNIMSLIIYILVMIVITILSYRFLSILGKLYPERNYPKPWDKKLNEKLIDMMDSGEQYITLVALQKTHVLNQQIIIGIICLSSIYSMVSNNNQFFSVTLMIILYLINTMYYTKKVSETL